jgi:PAS domain S-box-containing protein
MTATLDGEVDLRRANTELQRRLKDALAERDEGEAQRAAIAEILDVINNSPGDLTKVFNSILEKAHHLCGASKGSLVTFDGAQFRTVAMRGLSEPYAAILRDAGHNVPGSAPDRLLNGESLVQVLDASDSAFSVPRAAAELEGTRTIAYVPLRKEGALLGYITAYRQEVRPFTDKQIALLQNFAAQAVIAMENARLLTETREALEQQTATIEVLQVINSSPGELKPVFDAMLNKALGLCEATFGGLRRFDGKMFWAIAVRDASGEAAEFAHQPVVPDPGSASERIVQGESVVHIPDLVDTEEYRSGVISRLITVEKLGARTALWVALRKDDVLVGDFVIYRKEVRPFSDKQIALLQNFAAQAVIAMENARLINETREALEQQTATAEVVQVINASPGDLAPVFAAMLKKATLLCEAEFGILWTPDGERFRPAALHGLPTAFAEFLTRPIELADAAALRDVVQVRSFVHVEDLASSPSYAESPLRRAIVDLGKARTGLGVPLLKDDALLGVFVIYRQEVRPFTDKQIGLLQNFAAQAVIAMENARLLTETREALEQQTATADVLQVINSSPGDLAPVFEAILEKAHGLCGVSSGGLVAIEGERYRPLAVRGEPSFTEYWLQQGWIESATGAFAQLRRGEPVHISDVTLWEGLIKSEQLNRLIQLSAGRCLLLVPLRKDNVLFGAITALRNEVRPFSDKEIALLQNFAAQAVIAMENARLITETREALEQQTATAEVLGVINSSPGDLGPVFDAMLDKALSLCGAAFGQLWTYDGEAFYAAALRGVPKAYADLLFGLPVVPSPGSAAGELVAGSALAHILDIAANQVYNEGHPAFRGLIEICGARTVAAVPLRNDARLLGAISIYRQEVRAFSDEQIRLLQNFAAQAVIAMENARLLTETREALDQQTATAEVLGVINSSPGDLAPVFGAMLEKAIRLLGAAHGTLRTYDGEAFHLAAVQGEPAFVQAARRFPTTQPSRGPGRVYSRFIDGETVVHIADALNSEEYKQNDTVKKTFDAGGIRSWLGVALRNETRLLGMIAISRREVSPFTDKQIGMLQNFAAQAVIAMENARLITETHEALEQQTATAEVLQVINSSPGDLRPVFDAMLDKAMALCGIAQGSLQTYDGEQFRAVAVRGLPEPIADRLRQGFRPSPKHPMWPLLEGASFVHIADLTQFDHSDEVRIAVELGSRTLLFVPLRKDHVLLGQIVAVRQEVRPFSDKQIALLQNFAAQAVIAMENARLITETREALKQQTATAEVLQVINSSPGDLAPVFDAILEKAHTVCGASLGALVLYDGEQLRAVATRGYPEEYAALIRKGVPLQSVTAFGRLQRGERVVHVPDAAASKSPAPITRAAIEIAGVRTSLSVPLRRDNALLGYISAQRQEVRPYSDREIALLESFAAQAVIAMENARLITETHEALEQQTATSEVLQVINSSPGDLAPVFDVMLEKAMRLCDAAFGLMRVADGEHSRTVCARGVPAAYSEFLTRNPEPALQGGIAARNRDGEFFVHTIDLKDDDRYRRGIPTRRAMVDLGGARTSLSVALRRDRELLGAIHLYRLEVRPFSDRQITLLQNFAAQAVIAMENARLLTETREALEQQTATSEVLQVINSSPGELEPVFDAMLEKALRLCGAAYGALRMWDGELLTRVAWRAPHGFEDVSPTSVPAAPGSLAERFVRGENVISISDLVDDANYQQSVGAQSLVRRGNARTFLGVALRKDDRLLGTLVIYRQEMRPFTEKQIALLQNFAAQAVIAIENARLLNEIRQRQVELRVTFDNMVDGVAMFDEALRLAAWNRNFQQLLDLPDEFLAERHGFDEFVGYLTGRGEFGETDPETEINRLRGRLHEHYQFERTRPDGTVIEVRHNPMPDGGVVLIYSDITERKRSEAEIRSARDAAEAAYRDLKTAQASLIQAEKMASLGQLTAGIAHEIKNPLNFVNNFAGLSVELLDELKETAAPAITALDDKKRAEIDETIEMLTGNLEKIAEHGRRADNIVKSMLEHSRGSSGERRTVDLNGLIEEALNLAYHGGRAQDQSFNVALERDYAAGLAPIEIVPQDITRVCLNLFGNGFYAATKHQREGGDPNFKPTLKVSTRDLGDAVEIRIRDNGIGIPADIKDKLFQPFFTTKPTGEGTGLGLSISYDIVTQQHGGTIEVDSRVGEYTEFTVRLPRRHRTILGEAAS